MDLLKQLSSQRQTASLKARMGFGVRHRIFELMCAPAGFSISLAHAASLEVDCLIFLVVALSRLVAAAASALLALIPQPPVLALPRLPNVCLADRLLPTPAAAALAFGWFR